MARNQNDDLRKISDKMKELIRHDHGLTDEIHVLNKTLANPIDLTRDLTVCVAVTFPVRAEATVGDYDTEMSDQDNKGVCDQIKDALRDAGIVYNDVVVSWVEID